MIISWQAIGKLIWTKLTGSGDRQRELNRQTDIVIKGYRDLYEEKTRIIESYRSKHPGNGEELDQWKKREEEMMLKLIDKEKEVLFWKERAIFIEKENELLHRKMETRK